VVIVPATTTSISANTGPKGTTIIITGTGFIADVLQMKVLVNGVSAQLVSASTTTLTFIIPTFSPAPTSAIQIVVQKNGVQIGTSFSFTYLYTQVIKSLTNGTIGFLDGSFSTAKIEEIKGITIDSSGNVYSAQFTNPRVRKFGVDGQVTTMAGNGTVGSTDGNGAAAILKQHDYITSDLVGNIYIAQSDGVIRKIDPSKNVTTVGNINGYLQGIKLSKSGTMLYFHTGDRVGKIPVTGGVPTWITTSAGYGDVDGSLTTAQFFLYGGLAISDDEKMIYVSDNYNGLNSGNKVKLINLNNNTITTIAGKTGLSGGDGAALNVGFKIMGDLLLDNTGGLYITDIFNNAVKYLKNGQVTTIVGGISGDVDGALSTAKIYYPIGLAINKYGEIFVSCSISTNPKLKKITTE
jgi:IPT/TIG domain